MSPRIETATPPPELSLFDAIDSASNNRTEEGGAMVRAGQLENFPGGTACIFSAAIGVPALNSFFQGRMWFGALSSAGGGAFARQGTRSRVGTWPVRADLSAVPASGQLPCVYEVTVNLHRVTPLVSDVCFGLYLDWTPNTFNNMDLPGVSANLVGAGISSLPSRFGGNWTAVHRVTALGALVQTDLGIHPSAGVIRAGIRYFHRAANPQLEFLVNDVPLSTLVGLAALPDPLTPTGSVVQHCGVIQNQNAPFAGGQQDRWLQTRVKIDRLPGFDL